VPPDPTGGDKPADLRAAPSPPEKRVFDVDPEDSGNDTDHDRWLTENLPPHHR
jgi:hypothetical protein